MDLLSQGRGILGLLNPLTGTVASGRAAFSPGLAAPVTIAANTWLAPVINGEIRDTLVFRVVPNPAGECGAWNVTGTDPIDVQSLAGGAKQNLPAGTRLQWLDGRVPAGLDPAVNPLLVTDAAPVTGGTDAPTFGIDQVRYVALYESLGTPQLSLEAYSSKIGEAPAVLLIWDGSEPADGLTMSTLAKGRARVGRGKMAYKEQWSAMVISARSDSDARRRAEGLRILGAVADLLVDQSMFAGSLRLSAIDGIQIRNRFRLTGRTGLFANHYVYGVRLANTVIYSRHETRTFSPWLRSRIAGVNPDTNLPTDDDGLLLADVETDMPQT